MMERKTNMNITKIDKYKKKLNSTSMKMHKTDMNITKIKNTKNGTLQSTRQT